MTHTGFTVCLQNDAVPDLLYWPPRAALDQLRALHCKRDRWVPLQIAEPECAQATVAGSPLVNSEWAFDKHRVPNHLNFPHYLPW